MPSIIPAASSPGRFSFLASWAPTATNTATYPSLAQVLDREVDPGLLAVADLDAELLEDRHVLVDLVLGQPVRRDRPADHAAGIGMRFEDGDAEAGVAELLGRGEARPGRRR